MTSFETMKWAIGALPQEQKDNLRFHLEKGTPILCGTKYALYADGKGAG